jgi:hypothetical protein
MAEFLASLLSDPVTKAVLGFFSALGLLAAWVRTWFKEDSRYEADAAATRDVIPAMMRSLAPVTPMPALQVDQLNEAFKVAEKLTVEMNRLVIACERHTEETRRASAAAEATADESRRLCAAITRSSREAEDRWAQRNPSKEAINGTSRSPKR